MYDTEHTSQGFREATAGQRDASAGWKAEYWHQGVRFFAGFVPRDGDERADDETGGQDPLSDYLQQRPGGRGNHDVDEEARS